MHYNSSESEAWETQLSPLPGGDFRLLFFGQLISGFGSALTYVVLPIQMYQHIPIER